METRAGYVAVGGFVLILVAGAVAAILWLARLQTEEFSHYDIMFGGDVTGLQVGGPVRFRGIPVGEVIDFKIDPDNIEQVRVTIQVKEGTPVRANSVASLEVQGITGVLYVLISGGTQDAAILEGTRKQPHPIIASKAGRFEGLFAGAPDLIANINILVSRVSALMSPENAGAISGVLANLHSLTAMLSQDTGGIQSLLQEGAGAAKELRAMAEQFTGLAVELRERLGSAGGETEETLKQLRSTAETFSRLAGEVEGLVADSREPMRDFASSGLYEASQLIGDLRLLVATLSRVTEQFERDPARFLFGDRREGFEAQ